NVDVRRGAVRQLAGTRPGPIPRPLDGADRHPGAHRELPPRPGHAVPQCAGAAAPHAREQTADPQRLGTRNRPRQLLRRPCRRALPDRTPTAGSGSGMPTRLPAIRVTSTAGPVTVLVMPRTPPAGRPRGQELVQDKPPR